MYFHLNNLGFTMKKNLPTFPLSIDHSIVWNISSNYSKETDISEIL